MKGKLIEWLTQRRPALTVVVGRRRSLRRSPWRRRRRRRIGAAVEKGGGAPSGGQRTPILYPHLWMFMTPFLSVMLFLNRFYYLPWAP